MNKAIKITIVIIGLLYGSFITVIMAATDVPKRTVIILGIIAAVSVIALMFSLDPLQRKLSSKKSKTKKVDTS